MKKLGPLALVALVFGLSLGGATFTSGCASGATPARKAYTTIDDAVTAVQAAMSAFNSRYQSGLQTEADRTKVLGYYADFQTTAALASKLAQDVTQQANALQIASDAAAKILQLIGQLVPSTPPKTTWFSPPFLLTPSFGGA